VELDTEPIGVQSRCATIVLGQGMSYLTVKKRDIFSRRHAIVAECLAIWHQ